MVLFPINPVMLAKYRQAFVPSQAKDDPTDAELALELLTRHPERFKPLQPQSASLRRLAYLVEQRRLVVRDRVRFTNRVGNALKHYYPQALEWFDHYDTVVLGLVEQIRVTLDSLKRIDTVIAELAPRHPDYELFRPLPGAGAVLAPRLLVAFGEDRGRFSNAAAVQKYAGIAPVTERSGNKSWVHWRWQCPMFVRQTFVEWSEKTVTRSYWAGCSIASNLTKAKATRPRCGH